MGPKRKAESELSRNPHSVKSRDRAARLDPARKAQETASRTMKQAIRRKQKRWSEQHPQATEAERAVAYDDIRAAEEADRQQKQQHPSQVFRDQIEADFEDAGEVEEAAWLRDEEEERTNFATDISRVLETIGRAVLRMPRSPLSPAAKKQLLETIHAYIGGTNHEGAGIISRLMQEMARTPRLRAQVRRAYGRTTEAGRDEENKALRSRLSQNIRLASYNAWKAYWLDVAQRLLWKAYSYMYVPGRLFTAMQGVLGQHRYFFLRRMPLDDSEVMLLYCLSRCDTRQLQQWRVRFPANAQAYKARSRRKLRLVLRRKFYGHKNVSRSFPSTIRQTCAKLQSLVLDVEDLPGWIPPMDPARLGYPGDGLLRHVQDRVPRSIRSLRRGSFSDALAVLLLWRARTVPEPFERMLNLPSGSEEDMDAATEFVALACRPAA